MNGTFGALAARPDIQRGRSSWGSYALFALIATLYLLPFLRFTSLVTDEGTLLYGAVRIVHGEVFARDFFEVMGPGTFYWLAAFFKIFGVTFLASRICLFISMFGMALIVLFLSRLVCSRYQTLPFLILAGPFFGMLHQGISHHVDSNFFALLAITCMILWIHRQRNGLLILAGTLAGAVTCILQPKGVLVLLAILVWFWFQRKSVSAPVSKLALVMAPYACVIGAVLAYFWSRGALNNLINATFVYPSQHYSAVNVVAFGDGLRGHLNLWMGMGRLGWTVPMAAVLIVPYLVIAILPILILALGIRYEWKSVAPEVLLLFLCGSAIWASEFHRKDLSHFIWGSPLLVVVLFHLLAKSRRKIADLFVQVLSICAGCLACFNLLVMATAPSTVTRMGTVAMLEPTQALTYIDQHTSPGEDVFAYPYDPGYYFLSATTNPTRYSFLIHNFNLPFQFQEVIDTLDRRQVRYVIWDTVSQSRDESVFPGSEPSSTDSIVERYLESHYRVVQDDSGIRVMERISPDSTPSSR